MSKEAGTQKKETSEKAGKALSHARATPKSPAHHRRTAIPAAIRRVIWARDQGICQVQVDPNFGAEVEIQTSPPPTTRLCGSRTFLHIDHKTPLYARGTRDPDNLRLCCGAHNKARKSK